MKHLKLACLLLATTALFGCATSRSVVDIATPAVANGNGQKVFISVLDERRFELKPQVPEIPSLKEGEITDKSITERAIARKRNGYGMGLGDVKLAGVLGLYLGYLGWAPLIVGAAGGFFLGGLFGIILLLVRRATRGSAIPFGPWMFAGAWVGVFAGDAIAGTYLSLVGLS